MEAVELRTGSFRLPEKRASASLDVDDLEPQARPRVFSLESVSMRTRQRVCAEDSQLSSSLDSVDIKGTDVTTSRGAVAASDAERVARAPSSVSAPEKKRRLGFSFFRKSLPQKVEQSLSLGEELPTPPARSSGEPQHLTPVRYRATYYFVTVM